MKEQGFVSKYTVAQYKPQKTKSNEDNVANLLDRNIDNQKESAVVFSDLTYVRVQQKWVYLCFLVDLFNREIIGYSSGKNKDVPLVHKAFASVKINLNEIQVFHTDRGNEFKNVLIDDALETFGIKPSLSMKEILMIMRWQKLPLSCLRRNWLMMCILIVLNSYHLNLVTT